MAVDRVRHAACPCNHFKRLPDDVGAMGVRHQPCRATDKHVRAVSSLYQHLVPAALLTWGDVTVSAPAKPEAEIQAEIRNILKQIVSTVTFLPVIDEPTVFNILTYTTESADVPADEWVDTDPLAIEASKSQQVKLRSFSTDVHRIEAMVAYRYEG